MADRLIVDASAMVDLLVGSEAAAAVRDRLRGTEAHAPAHFDAEVLSAMGRLQRAGAMSARQVSSRVQRLADAPVQRHLLTSLLAGAWRRRHNLRLVDALYAELAHRLGAPIITTDAGMAAATPSAVLVVEG